MLIQGVTQAPTNVSGTDGNNYTVLQGKQAELVVAELHGKYYTQAYRGSVFWGSTASAGVLIPIASTTAPTFALWNPAGSGVNAALIKYMVGWVATTGTAGNIQFAFTTGNGSSVATGASISAFTTGTPTNGLIGSGIASKMKFTPSAATISVAGTLLGTTGMSQLTTTGTSTTVPMWQLQMDFDGTLVVPPGGLIFTVGSAALTSTFTQTLVWEEVPI